jgi:hypothetical protein
MAPSSPKLLTVPPASGFPGLSWVAPPGLTIRSRARIRAPSVEPAQPREAAGGPRRRRRSWSSPARLWCLKGVGRMSFQTIQSLCSRRPCGQKKSPRRPGPWRSPRTARWVRHRSCPMAPQRANRVARAFPLKDEPRTALVDLWTNRSRHRRTASSAPNADSRPVRWDDRGLGRRPRLRRWIVAPDTGYPLTSIQTLLSGGSLDHGSAPELSTHGDPCPTGGRERVMLAGP